MGREKQAISPTAGSALLAGTIGEALAMHARERIVHFFTFLFAVRACCDRAKAVSGVDVAPWTVISAKATHQVDEGFRLKNPVYYDFDDDDPAVIGRSASSCRNTDAAHFCNLGLVAGPWAQLAAVAATDRHVFDLLEMAKMLAGNTRHLPQRINIGPDRVIDVAHGELAEQILRAGGPVVTNANIAAYISRCSADMLDYRAKKVALKAAGLAACCDCYLAVYGAGPDGPYYTLSGYVWAECYARWGVLDRTQYLA